MKASGILVASILILLLAGSIPLIQHSKGSDPDAEWIPIIDLTVPIVVGPGSEGYITFSSTSLGITYYPIRSEIQQEAIDASPIWLQRDLAIKFDRMDPQVADRYASLILNTTDPRWLDEVAFVVAHSNVPTLTDQYFFPELLYDNARLIYETAPLLNYVRILEEEDYTTLAYIDGDGNGQVLPRDIYYWYVVHPKLSDDLPTYVDPNYNYTTDPPFDKNYGTPPPTGVFWRDHLLNYNRSGRPLLKDVLSKPKTIREAIQALNGWIDSSMMFTSDQERPVQPVRIYEKGKGRCGEYEDMRSAAARIALIPVVATSNTAEDHVWNEFWDQRWVHWDGTVDQPLMYEKGWGKTISTVWDMRGDGLSWTVTERYSEEWSNLTVTVIDANGLPVDGAKVDLQTENYYQPDIKTTTASSSTTYDGKVTFTIGDGRNYWIRADGGSLGTAPMNPLAPLQAITGSDGDVDYNVTLRLPRAADQKDVNPIEKAGSLPNVRIELDIVVTEHTTFGTSSVSGGPYDGKGGSGAIDLFVLDRSNADNYGGKLPVDAYNLTRRSSQAHILLLPANTDIYELILSNAFSQSTYEVVNVSVRTFALRSYSVETPTDGSSFEIGARIGFAGTFYTPYVHNRLDVTVDGDGTYEVPLSGPSWTYMLDTSGLVVGQHLARFVASDAKGTLVRDVHFSLKDSTSPNLDFAPIDPTYGSGEPIPLSGSAEDMSGIETLSLVIDSRDTIDLFTYLKDDGSWSYLLITDGLDPGAHTLTLEASDPYDNHASTDIPVTITEGDPPELSLDDGIDGSLHAVKATVTISGKVSDASGLSGLRLTIDSSPRDISSSVKDGYYSYGWTTKGESSGWHDLSLVAMDRYGSSSSIEFRILLDGTAPSLVVGTVPEYVGPSSPLIIEGKVEDVNGIARVDYSVDEGTPVTFRSSAGSFQQRFDTTGWTTGTHEVVITAYDKAGNEASTIVDVFFDGRGPEIQVSDVPRIVLIGENLVVVGSVQDETGISSSTIGMDGADIELALNGSEGSFAWERSTKGIGLGDKEITVFATDLVGNQAQTSIGFRSVDLMTDTDKDGMPDWWEYKFGLDPDSDGSTLDTDGDGVKDVDEYLGADGLPGNDDWSDPTDEGSHPSKVGGGTSLPIWAFFAIAIILAAICSAAAYTIVRARRNT